MVSRALIGLSENPARPMLDPCSAGQVGGLFAREGLEPAKKLNLPRAAPHLEWEPCGPHPQSRKDRSLIARVGGSEESHRIGESHASANLGG